jgi:hypothetical protein
LNGREVKSLSRHLATISSGSVGDGSKPDFSPVQNRTVC